VVAVLEGGYNLIRIADAAVATFSTLLGVKGGFNFKGIMIFFKFKKT